MAFVTALSHNIVKLNASEFRQRNIWQQFSAEIGTVLYTVQQPGKERY